MSNETALLIDDDGPFRERLAVSLQRRGWLVHTAGNQAQALEAASTQQPQHVLLDMRLGSDNGLDLLPELRQTLPEARIVVLTGYGSIATAMEAVRRGASDYLTKPADTDQIEAALRGQKISAEAEVPSLDRVEWEHLQRVLTDCDGNVSQAARVLGLDRRSLQRKLARFPPLR